MGFLTRKISPKEYEYINARLNQLNGTIHLVNTTVKPDIFFKRLNFMFDILMDLSNYEKYKVFKGELPSASMERLLNNLHNTVDDFITRCLEDNNKKQRNLKTEKGRRNCYEKCIIQLISAFDCSQTFWAGDRGVPHYSGPLYTEENYNRVKKIVLFLR